MGNIFSPADAGQGEPKTIVAGDLILWRRDDLITDFPTAEYVLTYTFQHTGETGSHTNLSITANEDSAGYYGQINGSDTLSLAVYGVYKWQAYITRSSDSVRVTVDEGRTKIITDFASQDKDARSHARIMLTKIDSLLEGRADSDVSNYSIQGRSLTKLGIEDLIVWRDYYRAELLREQTEENIRLGRKPQSTIKVRFTDGFV